jgi:hypothetical protein
VNEEPRTLSGPFSTQTQFDIIKEFTMAMILSEDSSSPSSFRWVRPKSGHSLNCGGGALGYPEQFENSRYPRGK